MKKIKWLAALSPLLILSCALTIAACKTQTKDTSSGQTAADEQAPSAAPMKSEADKLPATPAGGETHTCPYAQKEAAAAAGATEHVCPHQAGGGEAVCPHQTQAAGGGSEAKITCPVGGDPIEDISKALKSEYKGKTYYFGCENCKKKFDADPEKYAQ